MGEVSPRAADARTLTLGGPVPARRAFDVRVRPPGSKSLTNRALLLAALAKGGSVLRGALLEADDARRMIAAVRALGAQVDIDPVDGTLRVRGVGGAWCPPLPAGPGARDVTLDLGNAGTATRFLAAAALLSPVPIIIDGNERMRQRPIAELAAALPALGARVEWLGTEGCPPLRVSRPARLTLRRADDGDERGAGAAAGVSAGAGNADGSSAGATPLALGRTASGQFISALLLLGPFLEHGVTLRLDSGVTSASYVRMTLGLLDRLGASVRTADDLRVLRVGPRAPESAAESGADEPSTSTPSPDNRPAPAPGLHAFDLPIEPDASGATYFWGAAALCPGARVRVEGLGRDSLQADSDFPDLILSRLGASVEHGVDSAGSPFIGVTGGNVLRPVIADMSDMPDAAVTLAVLAAFARGPSVVRGVRTLRVKESDRVAALATELAKIGVRVESPVAGDDDAMTVTPPEGGVDCSPDAPPVSFATYDDHRIAMALALVALKRPGVTILDPACVGKTYPTYWDDFARLF